METENWERIKDRLGRSSPESPNDELKTAFDIGRRSRHPVKVKKGVSGISTGQFPELLELTHTSSLLIDK